jgi:hypothetical protein
MLSNKLLSWVVIEMSCDTESGRPTVVTAYGPFEDKAAAGRFSDWYNGEHDGRARSCDHSY